MIGGTSGVRAEDLPLRLVIVSMLGPMDLHVVRRVLERWPGAIVVRPIDGPASGTRRRRRWKRLVTSPVALLRGYARNAVRRRIDRRVDRQLRTHLYGGPERGRTLPPHETIPVAHLRDGSCADRFRAWAPDILLLAGAPILPQVLLDIPKRTPINIHHGIAPEYRGESCLFWALAREDWGNVGITVHRAVPRLDRGPVLVHAHVALDPRDTPASIAAKMAELGGRVVPDLLEAMEAGRLRGAAQGPGGRTYRYDDWRLRAWLGRWWRWTVRGRRPPLSPERVARHYERAPATAPTGASPSS